MFNKSILEQLIENAVYSCFSCGYGDCVDEEYETELRVTAEWTECSDPEYESIICITIFQAGVLKLSYEDPATKCN